VTKLALLRATIVGAIATLLLSTGPQASAAEPSRATSPATMKPVVVVSLASYDELHADIDFLGKASDNPDLVNGIDGLIAIVTQLQGLAGLDKTRPLGAAVRSDGVQFQMLAFVPVKNIKQLFSALSGAIGVPEKTGEHQWRINTRAGSAFVKEQGGWAFVAQLEDHLNDLPADPGALLAELPQHYDLAVRVHVQGIPEPLRDMMLDQLKQKLATRGGSGAKQSLAHRLLPGDGKQTAEAIGQLDSVTLGWSLDAAGRRTYFDVSITAVPGSRLAADAAAPQPSKMAGFLLPDATLSLHIDRSLPPEVIKRNLAIVESLKRALLKEIEDSGVLTNDDDKAKVNAWVDQTAAALAATVRSGMTNGGLVSFDGSPLTLAAGFAIEQSDKLDRVFREASELAETADRAPQFKLDIDKLGDVRFHRVTMPTDELIALSGANVDEMADLFQRTLGNEAQLTVGFGPGRVFAALGPEGLPTLKKVIEQSAKTSDSDDAALRVRLALGAVMQWWLKPASEGAAPGAGAAPAQSANPIWAQVADEVAAGGKDHLILTVSPIAHGLRVRLEGEHGVVKALGVGLKLMAVGGGPAGF
jgi:hypothetical protein